MNYAFWDQVTKPLFDEFVKAMVQEGLTEKQIYNIMNRINGK